MMSNGNNNDSAVYIFQGTDGEHVPLIVEKLIVNSNVRVLPRRLCYHHSRLRQATLSYGLICIEASAFERCKNLMEISIPSTVQHIGTVAFWKCMHLAKVDFEISTSSSSSPHQQQTIDTRAFQECESLQRIKLPSSVTCIGKSAFGHCTSLVELNLSAVTRITEISDWAFAHNQSLQTVILPNTLEMICGFAFYGCGELVTVIVPPDSLQPIELEVRSFMDCERLANFALPKTSSVHEGSFRGCKRLHERYGEDVSDIAAGLIGRFDGYSIHRMCYNHSAISVEELQKCIADQKEEDSLVDKFGMTPFHVLLSTADPCMELLDVLLDSLPSETLLKLKDANGRLPLDYLVNNWTDGAISLLHRVLQKWMIDRLSHWGATSCMEAMQSKVKEIIVEDDKKRRALLLNEAYSAFEHHENVEGISVLEMALWKEKLKSGWCDGSTKRQVLDRAECRCVCGADVVIQNVTPFLLV